MSRCRTGAASDSRNSCLMTQRQGGSLGCGTHREVERHRPPGRSRGGEISWVGCGVHSAQGALVAEPGDRLGVAGGEDWNSGAQGGEQGVQGLRGGRPWKPAWMDYSAPANGHQEIIVMVINVVYVVAIHNLAIGVVAGTTARPSTAQYGDAAVLQMLIEVPPQVVAKASEPLSAVDKMTVISNDGASRLPRTVADKVAQGMEMLHSTTGVDLAELLKGTTQRDGADGPGGADLAEPLSGRRVLFLSLAEEAEWIGPTGLPDEPLRDRWRLRTAPSWVESRCLVSGYRRGAEFVLHRAEHAQRGVPALSAMEDLCRGAGLPRRPSFRMRRGR